MSWHHVPKDDAWKQAHLAVLVRFGERLSVRRYPLPCSRDLHAHHGVHACLVALDAMMA